VLWVGGVCVRVCVCCKKILHEWLTVWITLALLHKVVLLVWSETMQLTSYRYVPCVNSMRMMR